MKTRGLAKVRSFGKAGSALAGISAALLLSLLVLAGTSEAATEPSFGKSTLAGESSTRPTSLQYGPDGRLYVAQQNGTIKVYTVERVGPNKYDVTDTENILLVKNIQNHDDDGAPNNAETNRQVTGLVVTGTAQKPVIYVGSSDPRIGGGGDAKDTNLDTNSGVISRLSLDGSNWVKKDLVRGLPRSEENHSTNGLQISSDGNTLYAAQGGNTNKGAPSNNFTFLPEYALSAAILSIDLEAIGDTTYDIPTLAGGGDPFGGDGGKNQAKLVSGGPVQVHAPGFRNSYDLVIAESGKMYTVDNGGNGGWGDVPKNEGPSGNCTNEVNEPGTSDQDSLHFVDGPGYYGGHPNPTRGNKSNTFGGQSPVPAANAVECDYRANGSDKGSLTAFPKSTNGLTEYTATNFEGAMKGDLLTAGFDNIIYRVQLNAAGDGVTSKEALFSNVDVVPLDVTAQGDNDPFPGTVWAADIGSGAIVAFEPGDFGGGGGGDACDTSNPDGDADGDGFTNKDEADNGTDPCSSADVPSDADDDGISNLNDPDDDNDGIPDNEDKFALDPDNGKSTKLPVEYSFDAGSEPGTLLDLGFTGLMTNGKDDYEDLYDPNNIVSGAAAPVLTVESVSDGDAHKLRNSQENGFQYGVDVGPDTGPFTAHTRIVGPFSGIQPEDFQSMGLSIGPGDQDNYAKLTTTAAGGGGGIEFAKEVEAAFKNRAKPPVPMPGPGAVDLFLTVNPAAKTVQPSYTVTTDGKEGERKQVGGPEPIPASWVDGTDALAVGLISTSAGPAPEFPATWDFLNVTPENSPEPPGESKAGAKVTMTPNGNNINASTFESGSFKITNTSATEKLDSATLDLGTAVLPDMIFDPEGKAGDKVAKKFTVDSAGGTGQSGHALLKPHNGQNDADGYEALKIDFNDFDPGETFAFSIDVDPNSIKGTPQPGPNGSGSVSGLELSGSTITTAFDDGTFAKNKAFSDGSKSGSAAVIKPGSAAAPKLEVAGVSAAKAKVSEAEQTVKVTGPEGAKVQLLRLEAGLFVAQDGGYNVEPYDANSAVALNKAPATIGSDGTVNIPVILTRQADPEAGLNHLIAVVEDAEGDEGLTSNVVVLDYDPDSQEGNQDPTVTNPGEQSGTEGEEFSLQIEASDPDDGDTLSYSAQGLPAGLSIAQETGLISGTIESGAASGSPYTVTVEATDPDGASDSKSFTFEVSESASAPVDPEAPAALVTIESPGNIESSSTFSTGSFQIKNDSGEGQIQRVVLDLSTAVLPDMVFDPEGNAGDKLGKCFKADSGAAETGLVTDGSGSGQGSCVAPFGGPNGGGYDTIEIEFDDFDPGETFTFSSDVDPTSIKGGPTVGGPGSVSGLELTGSTATVGFGGDVAHKTETYRIPASSGGSENTAKAGEIAKPVIKVPGVKLGPATLSDEHSAATVPEAQQTARLSGPEGATASLLVIEGEMGLKDVPNGGFDVEEYEANSAIKVDEKTAQIGLGGTVDIPVTLTDTQENAGLNYLVAVIKSDGRAGPNSDVVVLDYDESSAPPPNEPPTVEPIGNQKGVEGEEFSLQVEASDPDDGDTLSYSAQGLPAGLSIAQETGLISGTIESGAASGSPYTAKVTVSDGADESAETFEMTVAAPDSPPAPAELEMKPAERMGFGKVAVGEKRTKEVTVTNTGESGGATIEVSAAKIDGAETFSVSPEKSVELEPGDSHSLEVAFAPNETGVDRAKLLIEHSGENETLSLALSGRAVPGAGGCTIMGTEGDDTLRGTAGRDVICGLGGNDKLYGFGGDDILRGGDGNDRLFGGPGDDRLFGQDGRDFLFGGSGEDYANGGSGNDIIRGNQGNDRLVGATGNDTVIGGENNDTMFGGPGRDRVFGQEGRDVIIIRDGVRGNDSANGGPGRDRCAADPRDRVVSCP